VYGPTQPVWTLSPIVSDSLATNGAMYKFALHCIVLSLTCKKSHLPDPPPPWGKDDHLFLSLCSLRALVLSIKDNILWS